MNVAFRNLDTAQSASSSFIQWPLTVLQAVDTSNCKQSLLTLCDIFLIDGVHLQNFPEAKESDIRAGANACTSPDDLLTNLKMRLNLY